MKSKKINIIAILLIVIISFFFGRESQQLEIFKETHSNYFSDTLEKSKTNSVDLLNNPLETLSNMTIVYRCGKSKIYHPTTTHNSFNRCKSKVYELTIKKANELGMRHCKCSY